MKIEFYYYLIYSNATGKNIDEIINISSIYIIYHKYLKNFNTIKKLFKHKLI